MAEAFVYPERLRAFAHQLRGYSEVTANTTGSLSTQLQRLGTSWRDQEYERFAQEFHRAKTQLTALKAEIDKILPVIEADAQKAEVIHRD
jgi:uncharacterized protein YukE